MKSETSRQPSIVNIATFFISRSLPSTENKLKHNRFSYNIINSHIRIEFSRRLEHFCLRHLFIPHLPSIEKLLSLEFNLTTLCSRSDRCFLLSEKRRFNFKLMHDCFQPNTWAWEQKEIKHRNRGTKVKNWHEIEESQAKNVQILQEIMSYSHSRKPDLPVTHSSPLSTWLSELFFFSSPVKITLSGKGYGFCWWRR